MREEAMVRHATRGEISEHWGAAEYITTAELRVGGACTQCVHSALCKDAPSRLQTPALRTGETLAVAPALAADTGLPSVANRWKSTSGRRADILSSLDNITIQVTIITHTRSRSHTPPSHLGGARSVARAASAPYALRSAPDE